MPTGGESMSQTAEQSGTENEYTPGTKINKHLRILNYRLLQQKYAE